MPRKARIDAPGTLHHVIARGIEKGDIFWDDHDRTNFLERLGTIIDESGTRCYAWALLPNHPSIYRFIAVSKSLKKKGIHY